MADMPAGRELDALVAERVMGWPWRLWTSGKNNGKKFLADPLMEGRMVAQGAEPLHEDAYALVPPFSTAIAAAMQALERLKGRGRFIELTYDHVTELWQANFWGVWDEAEELPCAICLAALKALGGGPPPVADGRDRYTDDRETIIKVTEADIQQLEAQRAELRAKVTAQAERIAALEDETERMSDLAARHVAAIGERNRRIAALEDALRPFTRASSAYDNYSPNTTLDTHVRVADLRRAHKALKGE